MLTSAQSIILSNVSFILNFKPENIFKRNNVKLCTKISTLKARMTNLEYAHAGTHTNA